MDNNGKIEKKLVKELETILGRAVRIIGANSENIDFLELVNLLDADLAIRDGKDHSFYAPFNKIDKLENAVVVYENEKTCWVWGNENI